MHVNKVPDNLLTLFGKRIAESGDKPAYKFLVTDDHYNMISYRDFHEKVLGYAAFLQHDVRVKPKERALILYPPGLDYIYAFYACLFAGVIAVPAYPPDTRNVNRIISIIRDCSPSVILTTHQHQRVLDNFIAHHRLGDSFSGQVIVLPEVAEERLHQQYTDPGMQRHDIAFLQYTSGSTSDPKGVILTHENLMANSHCIEANLKTRRGMEMVSWLPPYHDMGLIGGIIHPLSMGMTATLMSPLNFVKKPARWLKMISNATHADGVMSPAPNFGFELCTEKVTEEQLKGLHLYNWESAICGAEPIRLSTYENFCRRFKSAGFKRSSFVPVYGLAEATLLFSGEVTQRNPAVGVFDAGGIKHNKIRNAGADSDGEQELFTRMIGCGPVVKDHSALIVNPDTLSVCDENTIGEIWIRGNSVAKGYWNKPADTAFNAYTKEGAGPYFRTGDLGFFREKQLYIAGRLKDCLIINGRNHYPQDIEYTVSSVDDLLRKDSTAVFVMEVTAEGRLKEEVVVVQEITRIREELPDFSALFNAIRRAVFDAHGINIAEILLIEQSSIPKTSSGKIMRHKAKELYTEKKLKTVTLSSVHTGQ